jgi:PAS domain S-box-containing protein
MRVEEDGLNIESASLFNIKTGINNQQSLFTSILDSTHEFICTLNLNGEISWINRATTTITGYRPEEIIGRCFLDLVYTNEYDLVKTALRDGLDGRSESLELRYKSKDNGIRYAQVSIDPLISENKIVGILVLGSDITEQKQERERAAQSDKLRMLGQLASGVAHDFNNALTAIFGRAQLMSRTINDDRLKSHLEVIQTAATDAAATIRRIQTFTKQTTEEMELVEVTSLIHDAIELTRTKWENDAQALGLTYEVKLEIDSSFYVYGSASELREVFVNLIVNAIDAMPEGGELLIKCNQDLDRLSIEFIDTGVGIAEDIRAKIFEPFYSTKGADGTGLGLFVSYGIAQRHKGEISVQSDTGLGSTFKVTLPLADALPLPSGDLIEKSHTPLTILVVDNEPHVRKTLAEMLAVLGHKVFEANNGRIALSMLSTCLFDLVFTDLSMPVMDGWGLIDKIRKDFPDIQVIVVTGYGCAATPPDGDVSSADYIIGKPFDFKQIVNAINRVKSRECITK